MLRLIPVIAEPIAITTVTPMATPRMVSAARTLLERSESSAMPDAFDHAGRAGWPIAALHSALSATIGSSREARLAG